MMKEIVINFFNVYFQFIVNSYAMYYIICDNFTLKVSRKKALVIAFFYANYGVVTDIFSLILVGERIIPYTGMVYALLKINLFLEALVPLLFILRYIDKVWYRCYWWMLILLLLGALPTILYTNYYITTDKVLGVTIHPVNMHSLPLYMLDITLNIIWGIILLLLGRYIHNIRKIDGISKWNWYIFYACFALFILFSEKNYFQDNTNLKSVSNYKPIMVFVIGTLIVLFISINATEKRRLRIENKLLMQHKKLQYTNYLNLYRQEQEIDRLYHEIGEHIKAIQILVEKGEQEEAQGYTRRLMQQYRSIRKNFYCNNKIINAVLSSKGNICSSEGISFETDIKLPDKILIREIDLMCIFSNLLDNAIESCLRYAKEEKYIHLKTAVIGNYLTVKVINSKPKNNSINKDKDYFKTSKSDKNLHGYGLKIIREIVEHYEGQEEFIDLGEEFSALVMLKNNMDTIGPSSGL